jgi:transposase InsO family protein
MKELFVLVAHLLATLVKLAKPGGARAVAAESIALKHQLLIMQRTRKRVPRLTPWDRLFFGLCSLWLSANRRRKISIVLRPSTFQRFHEALVRCKYRLLYTAKGHGKPGPKGPSRELIAAVVEMKRRNPRFGCLKIAQQISYTFDIELDKDVVRRILEQHHPPSSGGDGPSWLTAIAHAKDSLWSMNLFRCESILLQSFWVMVVIDVFTRGFVGFAVAHGDIDGPAICRMFNAAMARHDPPHYLSTDNDPLFRFHRWRTNLRIMDIEEIKSLPFVPRSHPFVERMIRTIREELLDRVLFWNQLDLERKLSAFRAYYNGNRVHSGIDGIPPREQGAPRQKSTLPLSDFRWASHCHGLFELPAVA